MTIDEANKFFEDDKYATESTGCVLLEIGENYAKAGLELNDSHKNAHGGVMGGVMFTLADFVFAAATNTPGHFTCNVTSTINFMSMPKGDKLIAEAHLIKDGRRNCYYEVNITDSENRKVALLMITGMHLS